MKKKFPKELERGGIVYQRTKYGSYVNKDEYGMAAQKNAMAYGQLIRLGYTPVRIKKTK